MLRLRLCVGDIAAWRGVDAVAVSSNRTLQGNDNPAYWRFAGRLSTNGAVRAACGPDLDAAFQSARRSGAACEVGEASVTPAFGALAHRGCRHIVHVVAPDGLQVHAGGSDQHVQRTAQPLLRQSFGAALAAAAACRARSLALPALGCGVNGWRPSLAAAACAYACADAAATTPSGGTLRRVDLVMWDDSMAQQWRETLIRLLGPSQDTMRPSSDDEWRLSPQSSATLLQRAALSTAGIDTAGRRVDECAAAAATIQRLRGRTLERMCALSGGDGCTSS